MLGIEAGPDWAGWLGWFAAALGAIGTAAASAWAWYVKQRDKEIAKVSKPYKALFEEVKRDLEKAQTGFLALQEEHASCRESLARLEERVGNLERERERPGPDR